ncbi:hypothetical protein CDL15_Pgr024105 [Punica granatum]|uniref:Uncharacterized protein n=1 Tax=Punica granatum TaxID=22663 RepID=A0A218XWB7_PUNGR|nr:hypothetical protein CDL15_Pgr024105 [Punica granatum]
MSRTLDNKPRYGSTQNGTTSSWEPLFQWWSRVHPRECWMGMEPQDLDYPDVPFGGGAGFWKRTLQAQEDSRMVYENEELDASIPIGGKLVHTSHMRFLDKAAILTEEDNPKAPNLWSLSTVPRVEELKSLIRMGLIWASDILLITAYAQQGTFVLQQARTMDQQLIASFQIPRGSMTVFTMTDAPHHCLRRSGLCPHGSEVHCFVEVKRKHAVAPHSLTSVPISTLPISTFWLVPQYALHGMAEAFISIGHLEFFRTMISIGNYTSTLLVTLVHEFTDWLPNDNLNKERSTEPKAAATQTPEEMELSLLAKFSPI